MSRPADLDLLPPVARQYAVAIEHHRAALIATEWSAGPASSGAHGVALAALAAMKASEMAGYFAELVVAVATCTRDDGRGVPSPWRNRPRGARR